MNKHEEVIHFRYDSALDPKQRSLVVKRYTVLRFGSCLRVSLYKTSLFNLSAEESITPDQDHKHSLFASLQLC